MTPVEFVTISIADAALNAGRLTHVDATILDANHQTLADRTVTWTASDTTVISVVAATPTRAAVRALGGGTSTLTATCEGKSASLTVTVYAPSVANVLTTLAASAIPVGQTTRASAFPVDSLGNPLSGKSVAWSSLNPEIATVSNAGIVSGLSSGSAVIRATIDSKVGEATLVVNSTSTPSAPGTPGTPGTPSPGATASVSATIDSTSIAVGHTAHATATAKDANGNVLTGKTASWTSQNPTIAAVDQTGVVTGVSGGLTQLQVTIDGVAGTVPLMVTVPSVITTPTPSGSGSHPNEPAGFVKLASQPFDAVENDDYYPSGVGNPSIISDPSNPGSSANVGQVLFPAGFVSGSSPGSEWGKHTYSPRTAYVSFFVKLSSNWWGNDARTNKVLYWNMIPQGGGNAISQGSIEIFGTGSGDLVPGLAANVTGFVQGPDNPIGTAPTVTLEANRGTALVTRGEWHRYEILITANTPGNTDGGLKWWFDGTLVGDYTNRIRFNDVGAPPADIYWSPTYGGAGNPVPANQYMWLKDLYVSGR